MVLDTTYSGGFSSTHWSILLLEFSTAIRKGSFFSKISFFSTIGCSFLMKQITRVLGYDFQSMVGSETHSVLNVGG